MTSTRRFVATRHVVECAWVQLRVQFAAFDPANQPSEGPICRNPSRSPRSSRPPCSVPMAAAWHASTSCRSALVPVQAATVVPGRGQLADEEFTQTGNSAGLNKTTTLSADFAIAFVSGATSARSISTTEGPMWIVILSHHHAPESSSQGS